MTKRENKYEIKEAVRGSFVGASGRVDYDLEAGTVFEKNVDPEVLALLLAAGSAVDRDVPVAASYTRPSHTYAGIPATEPVPADEPAESEAPA